ncbi:DNA-binding MarR family transcriptional regulator [Novosphingobium sp. SG751A]|uniref:MarR family winged helix-turn-helix transcriptional regulator n=1 Tax=Novosphingobium sp. SG751A TaxID=2587000 RepID=UPI001556B786|nr:MarR family transcriptional regulator [Novosphingobium sp. SG751A]NOW47663.1 DNA-binding MarR family transcriptional regulator [Novosphingobium sp. SG751A]
MAKRPASRARLKSPQAHNELTKSLDGVLAFQLRRAQEASFAAFAQKVGESDIWPGWYALLTIVHNNPGISQTELSKASGRDKSTLTASLRELSRKGLIVRDRDPEDQRRIRLSLSQEGESHLQTLRAHAEAHDAQFEAIVGQENRGALLAILKDIADQFTRFAEPTATRD